MLLADKHNGSVGRGDMVQGILHLLSEDVGSRNEAVPHELCNSKSQSHSGSVSSSALWG